MLKVYQQRECNLMMVLRVKSMHAGRIKWQEKTLNAFSLLDFWYQSFMAGNKSLLVIVWNDDWHPNLQINKFVSPTIYHIKILLLCRWLMTDLFTTARHDVIAQMYYARRLAEKLYPVARMVDLHGGHLVSRERTEEVYFFFHHNQSRYCFSLCRVDNRNW